AAQISVLCDPEAGRAVAPVDLRAPELRLELGGKLAHWPTNRARVKILEPLDGLPGRVSGDLGEVPRPAARTDPARRPRRTAPVLVSPGLGVRGCVARWRTGAGARQGERP